MVFIAAAAPPWAPDQQRRACHGHFFRVQRALRPLLARPRIRGRGWTSSENSEDFWCTFGPGAAATGATALCRPLRNGCLFLRDSRPFYQGNLRPRRRLRCPHGLGRLGILSPTRNIELVPLIFVVLIWVARDKIRQAPKAGANSGLVFVAISVAFFLIAARCLQPRMALLAIPFLIYGSVRFLWGRGVVWILPFPCRSPAFHDSGGSYRAGYVPAPVCDHRDRRRAFESRRDQNPGRRDDFVGRG